MLTSGDAEIVYVASNNHLLLKLAADADVVRIVKDRFCIVHSVSVGLVKEMFVQCRDVLQRLDVDTDSL